MTPRTQAQSDPLVAKGTKKACVENCDIDLLYGLYKQATEGNAPTGRFSIIRRLGKGNKMKAWGKLSSIPEETLEKAFHHIHLALAVLKEEDTARENPESEAPKLAPAPSARLLRGPQRKLSPTAEEKSVGSTSSEGQTGQTTVEESDMSPEDMLLVAAGEDDIPTLSALLERGAAIDHVDECGQTALHMAADHGAINAVKLLIEHGANVGAADQHGVSVLQAAVIAGHVELCKLLLEQGADPNQYDEDGDSPKMCAMDDGSPEMQDLFDDEEDEEDESHSVQESTISWATEFTIEQQITNAHKIIDRVPSILDT